MRVRFTHQAERQYLEALQYIRAKIPAGAETVQHGVEAVVELLRDHPHSGHPIPEFAELPHRELFAAPYRFFHRTVDETVWIVGIWHARQLPEPPGDMRHA